MTDATPIRVRQHNVISDRASTHVFDGKPDSSKRSEIRIKDSWLVLHDTLSSLS